MWPYASVLYCGVLALFCTGQCWPCPSLPKRLRGGTASKALPRARPRPRSRAPALAHRRIARRARAPRPRGAVLGFPKRSRLPHGEGLNHAPPPLGFLLHRRHLLPPNLRLRHRGLPGRLRRRRRRVPRRAGRQSGGAVRPRRRAAGPRARRGWGSLRCGTCGVPDCPVHRTGVPAAGERRAGGGCQLCVLWLLALRGTEPGGPRAVPL
jgi:hypothetical protein